MSSGAVEQWWQSVAGRREILAVSEHPPGRRLSLRAEDDLSHTDTDQGREVMGTDGNTSDGINT